MIFWRMALDSQQVFGVSNKVVTLDSQVPEQEVASTSSTELQLNIRSVMLCCDSWHSDSGSWGTEEQKT